MQNNLLASISLALLFTSSLNADFVSPYADSASQSAEDRLKTTTLKSVELEKEIARKEAIAKAEREKAQKIKEAKIAKHFTKKSDLEKSEKKIVKIAKKETIEFEPLEKKENAPVNLEDEKVKKEDAFFDNLKSKDTHTMKME